MSSEVALRIKNLSKCYQIYDSPRDRLRQFVLPKLRHWGKLKEKNYFNEFWAARDVSFEIGKGETVGIIGRNGSGKSTLLQMICGTLTPTSGTVETSGRVAALLELGAGFNPEFTGKENVYMNASLLGLSRGQIETKYDDIVAFADIGDFVDRPVKTYSSGMYVRLAFSVIAHADADILIIDEALAVGDAFFTQKCMRFLREFQECGTILFVSHDTAAVVGLCRRAVWLEKGMVLMAGTSKDVCEAYLASQFEERQGPGVKAEKGNTKALPVAAKSRHTSDQRLRFINESKFRNDIEVFNFSPLGSCFGFGGGEISDVLLHDESGTPLTWMVGGEEVTLVVRCHARQSLERPIVGFYFKDRLGQFLFGDNTYLSYADRPLTIMEEEILEARFRFRLPILPAGDYSICVALADGTQREHVQHRWVHDALILKSHASSVVTGLIGIPMQEITMEKVTFPKMAERC